jgi:hypothetical protein
MRAKSTKTGSSDTLYFLFSLGGSIFDKVLPDIDLWRWQNSSDGAMLRYPLVLAYTNTKISQLAKAAEWQRERECVFICESAEERGSNFPRRRDQNEAE